VLLDLLFGSYRQRVLTQLLLHPDSSYHVRELARLTGTAPGTLHKELSRLAGSGLLQCEKQGNQVRYKANRDCPVFAELAGLFRKTSGVVSVLADALRSLSPEPQLALVFGSIARGEENANSDVDLLLITDCSFGDAVKVLHPAQEQLQREINPAIYNATEFKRRIASQDDFIGKLLANPKLFVIGTEHDLGKFAGFQRLQAFEATPGGVLRLLASAERNLADARLSGLSADNRFDTAYKAIMQCAMIGLWANGYRTATSQPGHHQTALQALPKTMNLPQDTVIVLDALRKQRNLNDYEGDSVTDAAVKECLSRAEALFMHTRQWLETNRPDLLVRNQ
jgi:predicted nucleotidyltransferase